MATELIVKIVDADADDDVLERSALLLREEIGALDREIDLIT